MENFELEQRLVFLKKELALKKQKLEKYERKKRAKEHVRQKIKEHLVHDGMQYSRQLPLSVEQSAESYVLTQLHTNTDKSRKCCVSFKLSPLGPIPSCDCSSNNTLATTKEEHLDSHCSEEGLASKLIDDVIQTKRDSRVKFDQEQADFLSSECSFETAQRQERGYEASSVIESKSDDQLNDSMKFLFDSDLLAADELCLFIEEPVFVSKTDSDEASVYDEVVNVLRNSLGVLKIVIQTSIDTGPTDFALPEPIFGDLMREKQIDFEGSTGSSVSHSLGMSMVNESESAQSLASFNHNIASVAMVACHGSSSDTRLYRKTDKHRGRPRKLCQNDIRQNSTCKSVTDSLSNVVLMEKCDRVVESGETWTLSAVDCTKLEETDEVLSIDCEMITVAGVCTCALLACTAGGFTVSVVDDSSRNVLLKWSPTQNEAVMLARLMPGTVDQLSALVALRCSSATEYCLVTFSMQGHTSSPTVLQRIAVVLNCPSPIVCIADSREFVVVTSVDDNNWLAKRYTVDHDRSSIMDSIKLQEPTSKPSIIIKIDDYGCVCGVGKNHLTIWHLETGLILQKVTTEVHVTSCSRIFAEDGLLFIPCLVDETDVFGCLLVVNPLTAKSCTIGRFQKPNRNERFFEVAVADRFICAISESGSLCAWNLRSSELVFCSTEHWSRPGSNVRCLAVDRRSGNFLMSCDNTLHVLSLSTRLS